MLRKISLLGILVFFGAGSAYADPQVSLQKKVRLLQTRMERVQTIPAMMDEKFQPLLQAGKFREAEAIVDAALKRLEEAAALPAPDSASN